MKKILRVLLWCLVIVVAIFVGLYLAVFDVWIVPKGDAQALSLSPTLSGGDIVLVARKGSLEGERLVRCAHPASPGTFVAARAYGYPGSKIAVEAELVVVDGKRWTPRESCDAPKPLVCASEFGEGEGERYFWRDPVKPSADMQAVVQPNKLFIVSDQRHAHFDSRDYGPVDLGTCHPIVWRLYGTDSAGRAANGTTVP